MALLTVEMIIAIGVPEQRTDKVKIPGNIALPKASTQVREASGSGRAWPFVNNGRPADGQRVRFRAGTGFVITRSGHGW